MTYDSLKINNLHIPEQTVHAVLIAIGFYFPWLKKILELAHVISFSSILRYTIILNHKFTSRELPRVGQLMKEDFRIVFWLQLFVKR